MHLQTIVPAEVIVMPEVVLQQTTDDPLLTYRVFLATEDGRPEGPKVSPCIQNVFVNFFTRFIRDFTLKWRSLFKLG